GVEPPRPQTTDSDTSHAQTSTTPILSQRMVPATGIPRSLGNLAMTSFTVTASVEASMWMRDLHSASESVICSASVLMNSLRKPEASIWPECFARLTRSSPPNCRGCVMAEDLKEIHPLPRRTGFSLLRPGIPVSYRLQFSPELSVGVDDLNR